MHPNQTVSYRQDIPFEKAAKVLATPTDAQWRAFWHAVDQSDVSSWPSDYQIPPPMEGSVLERVYVSITLVSPSGQSAKIRAVDVFSPTGRYVRDERFNRLDLALSALVGVRTVCN